MTWSWNRFAGALLLGVCFSSFSLAAQNGGNQLIFGRFEMFVGDSGKSLTGSYGYTGGFQSYSGSQSLKWLVGTSFTFASAGIRLNNVNRNASLYGADFKFGAAWTPLTVLGIHPILEVAPMVGAKFLSITSPPAGIDENGVALSYGASIAFGVDLKMGSSSSLRVFFEYLYRKATSLGGQTPLDLDAFGISVGWLF